jgi:hypothetical protein
MLVVLLSMQGSMRLLLLTMLGSLRLLSWRTRRDIVGLGGAVNAVGCSRLGGLVLLQRLGGAVEDLKRGALDGSEEAC